MLSSHALGIGFVGLLFTLFWLFMDREKTVFTSSIAFLAWGYLAIYGGSVHTVSAGQIVEAPIPDTMRVFFGLLAFMSGAVALMYVWEVYPPEADTGSGEPEDGR